MLAMLRKELRQSVSNLLALPGLAIAGGWAVAALARNQYRGSEYSSILNGGFGGGVTITCALVGLMFGLKQMLAETRVGAWAFLRHRPVSPGRLFFAKLLAALIYYCLVVGFPLAGVIWWASRPGNFPGPWLWRMTLPSLADFLCGTVYVVAGLFIASREARWFGSRLLPLGFAVLYSFMTWMPWWWVGFAAIALGWAVLLPAALGAFNGRGRESRQGAAPRMLTAVTLLPALIALPLLAATFLETLLVPERPYYGGTWYSVCGDDVFAAKYSAERTEFQPLVGENGELLTNAPAQQRMSPGYVASAVVVQDPDILDRSVRHYRMPSHLLTRINRRGLLNEHWYFVRGWNCIVGYRVLPDAPATAIGYIGAGGFAADRRRIIPFDGREHRMLLWNAPVVVEPKRVFLPDLEKRTCSEIFAAPAGERIYATAMMGHNSSSDVENEKPLWVVSTDQAIYVLDGVYRWILRQPHVGGNYTFASVGVAEDRSRLAFLYIPQQYESKTSPLFIRVKADGGVISRTELPPTGNRRGGQNIYSEAFQSMFIPPGAVAADAAWWGKLERKHTWVIGPLLVSLAGAAGILRLHRASRGAWVTWLITVALLGVAGLLLMPAVRDAPPRIPCPRCGRKTPATKEACLHCRRPFAPPDPGDIAIFDTAGS